MRVLLLLIIFCNLVIPIFVLVHSILFVFFIHRLQTYFLTFLPIELFPLVLSIVLCDIVFLFEAFVSLATNSVVVVLVLFQNVFFLLLVFYVSCGFHCCISLFEHFVVKLLFHSEFHHKFVP